MISYSTGDSGTGADVDKVREATRIAKERAPHLAIDGPLQYDAAAIESVGKQKAPDSPVAGKATVFVFPDLNTGNTTYKAVQRSARVVSVGPMLQGLNKPVNDLSRGAWWMTSSTPSPSPRFRPASGKAKHSPSPVYVSAESRAKKNAPNSSLFGAFQVLRQVQSLLGITPTSAPWLPAPSLSSSQ